MSAASIASQRVPPLSLRLLASGRHYRSSCSEHPYGGTGNLSLYLRKGAVATESRHGAFSTRPGNSETVQIPAPPADTYYVTVVGAAAFANASISLHLGQ
ncbi:PPC domain-containing protein [Stenotrophomonas sp. LARHCG68]